MPDAAESNVYSQFNLMAGSWLPLFVSGVGYGFGSPPLSFQNKLVYSNMVWLILFLLAVL